MPRARAGDEEEPTLLLQQVSRSWTGADPLRRQLLRTQGRSPSPQIWPSAFLHSDDPDVIPLQPLGSMGGEQPHSVGAGTPVGHRFRGQLLIGKGLDERSHAEESRIAPREARGRVEQRHHGIQIVIGRGAAGQCRGTQALGPPVRIARAGPEGPEHLLRIRAGLDLSARLGEHARQPPNGDRRLVVRWQRHRPRRTAKKGSKDVLMDQIRRGRGGIARLARTVAQCSSEAAEIAGRQTDDRTRQHVQDLGRRRRRRTGSQAENGEQCRHGWLVLQGDLVCCDDGRYPRGAQGAVDGRDVGARAHEDRHLRPGHRPAHVGLPNFPSHMRGLRTAIGEGAQGDEVVDGRIRDLGARGLAMSQQEIRRQSDRKTSPQNRSGGSTDAWAESPGRAQDDDRCRFIGCRPKGLRKPEQPVHVRAAKAVDGLVGITHGDDAGVRSHQRAQERDLQRIGVLVLIHVDGAVPRPEPALHLRVLGPDNCLEDELAVVEDVLECHDLLLLLDQLPDGHPGRPILRTADASEGWPVETEFARPNEDGAHFIGQAEGRQCPDEVLRPVHRSIDDGPAEQLTNPHVLFSTRHQAWWIRVLLGRRRLLQQAEGEGVEGSDGRDQPAPHASSDTVTQFQGRAAAEGEREDRIGRQVVLRIAQPSGDGLHDGGGLARARASQHEERPPAMRHDRGLLGVKIGDGRRRLCVDLQAPAHEAWIPPGCDTRGSESGTIGSVSPEAPTPSSAEDEDLQSPVPPVTSEPHTAVIEDPRIPRRVRRPLDLARFVLAVAITAGIILLAYFATDTAAGLDSDLETGASLLPSLVVLVLNIIGGLGTLGLPIAVAVAMVLRRRVRQLFDALVALFLGIVVLTAVSWGISALDVPALLVALAGSTSASAATTTPILGGLVAFLTVARTMGRRPWNVLTVVVIGSLIIVSLLSGGITFAGVGISLTTGWAVGLMTRYAAGTPTTRPSGLEVAAALDRGGFPITVLQALESTSRGRRYLATSRAGGQFLVTVLDRDLEGAGLANAIWTSLRLRDDSRTGAFNMRRSLDHSALVSYAAQAAGAPVPRLLLSSEVGPDSVLMAHEYILGTRFSELEEVTDEDLVGAWRALRTLHESQITHRSLSPEHLIRSEDGSVWLIGGATGAIAAGDLAQRIDTAELLTTLALLTDVTRAVATGRTVLGTEGLAHCLPALQPVALSPATRRTIRKRKDVLVALRDALAEIRPGANDEQINFERFRPRTLIMIIVGTIAGYVLISQLAQVDLVGLLRTADWAWMAAAFAFAIITYFGAAWSLSGFVPERLPLHRTIMAQIAGDFATLVSPPTLGAIAINVRFLQKAGLHPALAGASVGVSQVMAFVFHILLLLGFGIAAGTQTDLTFDPPRIAVVIVVAVLILILALLAVPAVRRLIAKRVGPLLKEVGPRLVTVAQRPLKLLEGIGGILLLNLAYIGVLYSCVLAFDGSMSIAVVGVVYLAGATIGQAAPTPGGLGAVEAALAAGLTAGGLDAGLAVSAVLLYRLITFWIPTIPGYWAFNWLTKKGAL